MRKLIILLLINTLFAESDHLIFSKIVTRPTNSEMIVISNPTSEEIDMIVSLVESCLKSFIQDDQIPIEGILAN